jgi:nicotinamide mononucleotide (NMN) deamidase PncC
VFVGVSSPAGLAVRRYRFAGTRAVVRERSAQTALDLARRALLGLPLEAALEP